MAYCVYTDTNTDDGNYDHVIPLSLGGHNQFCVWSEREMNSTLGTNVDAPIANDWLVMFARRNADARGHSGKAPIPVWKGELSNGKKVAVKWGRENVEFYDYQGKSNLSIDGYNEIPLTTKVRIDILAPLRFVAKVSLGLLYYNFQSEALKRVNCEVLRKLMLMSPGDHKHEPGVLEAGFRFVDRLRCHEPDERAWKVICEASGRTTVVLARYTTGYIISVAVVGMFIGSLYLPFKNGVSPEILEELKEDFVYLLGPGSPEKISVREFGKLYFGDLLQSVGSSPSPESS